MVRNLTNFGVFVELEQGVDGLVHISDLSWTKKVRHPGEIVKKGDELDVVILGVDVDQRRISLGHKQIDDNPWDRFGEDYRVGTEVEGKIVRIIEKGVIVELPLGVDGFVPASQLGLTPVRNIAEQLQDRRPAAAEGPRIRQGLEEDRAVGGRVPEDQGFRFRGGVHGEPQAPGQHDRRFRHDHRADARRRYVNPDGELTLHRSMHHKSSPASGGLFVV